MEAVDGAEFGVKSELWDGLRNCQRQSVERSLRYTGAPLAANSNKSCLISLPTGAGKTGVISVVAHHAEQKRVLVLCHRTAVRQQLLKEIDGGFFEKTCPGIEIESKSVFAQIDNLTDEGIYVATFQKLNRLVKDQLDEMKRVFDLIIIDEGHSEPSPVWQTLVRGSNAHKIVITATPYRNDLFQFDVSPTASYVYTFAEALEDGVVRDPRFDLTEEVDLLATVLAFLAQYPTSKCILKCKTFEKVEEYFQLFNSQTQVLAVHERYTNDPRDNAKTGVPAKLSGSDFRVLIHQHKLDEGVDVPEAKLLVLTYVLGSGRELVQTVGRIVRVAEELEPLVLEFEHANNFSMWSSYRDFDASLRTGEGVRKFLASLDTSSLIELYLEAFPEFSYHENRFVGKFNLNSFDPDKALSIPTASICFLETKSGFSLQAAADTIYWRATNQGELSKVFQSNSTPILIILSITFSKSRFLANELFFEPTLELTLLKQFGNSKIAIYDSRGRAFSFDDELNIGGPLSQDQLLKVMTLGATMRPKEASTRSISSALRRPESISIKGQNLDQLGGQQQNAAYRMATVKCDTFDRQGKKSGSYYVGVDAGRISDRKESRFSMSDLNEWFEMIEACLSSNAVASSTMLNSFSKPFVPNGVLEPESLVFDFSSYSNPLIFSANGVEFEMDNSFLYFEYDAGFCLHEGREESRIKVSVTADSPFLQFSTDYDINLVTLLGGERLDAIDLLAKSLHKALFKNGVSFAAGNFYELKLPTQEGFTVANSELGGVMVGLENLLRVGLTEKGDVADVIQTAGDEFSDDSVFCLIDKLKNYSSANATIAELGPFQSYLKPDYILCSDMGTEPADFILSSPEKLVYVHVKCGSSSLRPQSSAGAVAEVGSQAIKNLEMLISSNRNLKAANWGNMLTEWPSANAPQSLQNRIRLMDGRRFDGAAAAVPDALERFWDVIASRRNSVGVRKEIWIVAANSFSLSDFEEQMRRGALGRSQSLQAYQLIQSWMTSAANMDAELRIFVSE
jgi:superfamily II DNA or RNA helicase